MVRREEYVQYLSDRDLRRIENYLDGFGMSGLPSAHRLVPRRRGFSARISGDGAEHSLHMLEDGLNPPEAATSQYDKLGSARHGQACVAFWSWDSLVLCFCCKRRCGKAKYKSRCDQFSTPPRFHQCIPFPTTR